MLCYIVVHVSRIILDAVAVPILKANNKASDFRESPVTKYLKDSWEIIYFNIFY